MSHSIKLSVVRSAELNTMRMCGVPNHFCINDSGDGCIHEKRKSKDSTLMTHLCNLLIGWGYTCGFGDSDKLSFG